MKISRIRVSCCNGRRSPLAKPVSQKTCSETCNCWKFFQSDASYHFWKIDISRLADKVWFGSLRGRVRLCTTAGRLWRFLLSGLRLEAELLASEDVQIVKFKVSVSFSLTCFQIFLLSFFIQSFFEAFRISIAMYFCYFWDLHIVMSRLFSYHIKSSSMSNLTKFVTKKLIYLTLAVRSVYDNSRLKWLKVIGFHT